MKLSELRPCANCNVPVFDKHGVAYLIKVSQLIPNKSAVKQTLGLATACSSLQIAEVLSPSTGDEITVVSEKSKDIEWSTLFICFKCAVGLSSNSPLSLLQMIEEQRKEDT